MDLSPSGVLYPATAVLSVAEVLGEAQVMALEQAGHDLTCSVSAL